MSTKVVKTSLAIRLALLAITFFVLGFLVSHIFWHPKNPLIGTCENTDVGVTIGHPMQFSSRNYQVTFSAISNTTTFSTLGLVDSFPYASTRVALPYNQRIGEYCYCALFVVGRDNTISILRSYDLTTNDYVVDLRNNWWHIYRTPDPTHQ